MQTHLGGGAFLLESWDWLLFSVKCLLNNKPGVAVAQCVAGALPWGLSFVPLSTLEDLSGLHLSCDQSRVPSSFVQRLEQQQLVPDLITHPPKSGGIFSAKFVHHPGYCEFTNWMVYKLNEWMDESCKFRSISLQIFSPLVH